MVAGEYEARFGSMLRRYRVAAELTQEDLAERARLSVRAISDLERGVNRSPRQATLEQLAEALQLDATQWNALQMAARMSLQVEAVRSPSLPPAGDFLGASPLGPLLAREAEWEHLLLGLEGVSQGVGRLVLLTGEAGIGKTRLVQEVAGEVRKRGFGVGVASCTPHLQVLPLAVWAETLASLRVQLPSAPWPGLLKQTPEVERLLREGSAPASEQEQHRLDRALTNLVLTLAEERPLAVLLDDLQHADTASLVLLGKLARSGRPYPVLLMGTYREEEVSPEQPLGQLSRELLRHGLGERITLRRLPPEGTAALVAAWVAELDGDGAEDFVEFVHRRSKGNPYYTKEMVLALDGRYRLLRQIGAGGMGRVFEAVESETARHVAVKIMLARTEPEARARQRFEQEAAILATVHHPHVVQLYSAFSQEHASYLVMEYLEGSSLGQLMRRQQLSLERIQVLLLQVLDALACTHERGIAHRDIKPDNIMVLPQDEVKVTDFGIARLLHPSDPLSTMTSTGMTMGTPLYMAPEQIRGQKVDGRTDLYAVGAVLYHLVTGQPPFQGDDPLSVAVKHLQERPFPPSALHPTLPKAWDMLILKALAKDPKERFQRAPEFSKALAAIEISMPDSRVRDRWVRRGTGVLLHARVLSVALTCLLLLALVGGTYLWPALISSHGQTASRLQRPVLLTAWGTHISVPFHSPDSLALGPNGTLYLGDASDQTVLQLSASGQALDGWQVAGSAYGESGSYPQELAADPRGDVYVADQSAVLIRKFSPHGRQVAALGQYGFNPGELVSPTGVALDVAGNIYVADSGPGAHQLQKWSPSGKPLAAWPLPGLQTARNTQLSVKIDAQGTIYVIDRPSNQIAVLSAAGKRLALWNSGSRFTSPSDLAIDRQGDVYVADARANAIEKLSPDGKLLARWGKAGEGPGEYHAPSAITVDQTGTIYVADSGNNRIQKLSPNGKPLLTWHIASLLQRIFRYPQYIALDRSQNMYVSDALSAQVVKLSPAGLVLARFGRGYLLSPAGVAVDGKGNLFVADSIGNRVVEFAPGGTIVAQWDLTGSRLGPLQAPQGVAVDESRPGAERIYVADQSNDRLVVLAPHGRVLTAWYGTMSLQASSTLIQPQGLAVDAQGNVYEADGNWTVMRYSPAGKPINSFSTFGTFARVLGAGRGPQCRCLFKGVAVDRDGNLYAANDTKQRIDVFAPGSRLLRAFGGKGSGIGTFLGPTGLAIGRDGSIYVVDTGNARVEKFSPIS